MKIGSVETKNNIFLAPMAGITDMAFRKICFEHGCGMAYSEMVSAKGFFYESENTKKLAETDISEKPSALQLFGCEPEIMADTASKLNDYPIDLIDINMGCPAHKIVKNGEGSALMLKPKLAGQIIRAVSKASKKPVTIKIRKGFDSGSINALEIAQIAEENGAAAVAVHPRTRTQYYSGNADWDVIKEIKRKLNIPVIGNGDITCPEKAKEMLEYTGCDAVMIGRAAQGNPWIFERTAKYIETGILPPVPSKEEKINVLVKHINMLCENKGEYIGIREARKHIAQYVRGMRGSSNIRVRANQIQSRKEMLELLENYKTVE